MISLIFQILAVYAGLRHGGTGETRRELGQEKSGCSKPGNGGGGVQAVESSEEESSEEAIVETTTTTSTTTTQRPSTEATEIVSTPEPVESKESTSSGLWWKALAALILALCCLAFLCRKSVQDDSNENVSRAISQYQTRSVLPISYQSRAHRRTRRRH